MSAMAERIHPTHPIAPEDLARAGFYALLARLFGGAPDAALLRQIAAAGEIEAEDAASALPRAWQGLRAAAEGADPEALRQEFDDVFIGVGKPQAMLYGSYYLAGFMMEKPLALLREDLGRLGFSRQPGVAEPEDHIAALADVMRLLITDTTVPAQERAQRQHAFFARHVEPWYRKLFAALAVAPGAGFYRAVGEFGRTFLDLESEAFQIESV
jgi:TorA maturation chaperone TorD